MYQDESQTASDFLSDLYVELVEVVKEGGATLSQTPRLLLKQFVRGCRDENLITKLELEKKYSSQIEFPDLISMVRREEARRTERKLRLKRSAHSRAAVENAEMVSLQQKVVELEAKCQSLEVKEVVNESVPVDPQVGQLQQRLAQVEAELDKVRKRSFFCYKCGIDNHIASQCHNVPNKTLVRLKLEQRQSNSSTASSKK